MLGTEPSSSGSTVSALPLAPPHLEFGHPELWGNKLLWRHIRPMAFTTVESEVTGSRLENDQSRHEAAAGEEVGAGWRFSGLDGSQRETEWLLTSKRIPHFVRDAPVARKEISRDDKVSLRAGQSEGKNCFINISSAYNVLGACSSLEGAYPGPSGKGCVEGTG